MLRSKILGLMAGLCPAVLASAGLPALPATAAPEAVCQNPDGDKVLKALDAWMKTYRRGKIDFHDTRTDIFEKSIAKKYGVLPKGLLGTLTWQRELEILLEMAVAIETPEAAAKVLEVAAAGLDKFRYTRAMAPHLVRDLGEEWIVKFRQAGPKDYLLRVARGEERVDRSRANALRAAALRAIGAFKEPSFRPTLEQQLGATEMQVRLAAAEGLQRLGSEAAVEALARALEREQSDLVIEALVGAIRSSLGKYTKAATKGRGKGKEDDKGKPGEQAAAQGDPETAPEPVTLPDSARLAIRAAIGALGRAGWRADMVLVSFLEDFRSIDTVPALIDILQKFKDNPDLVRSGELSGLLKHRAHETLTSLTGAFFGADEPERWREFWEKERASIQLVSKKPEPKAGTVSSGFFGIPVQGSRVIFVLDLSGSMDFPMNRGSLTGDVPDELPTRLDAAKKELLRAVDGLPEVSSFNLIWFNGNPRAKKWQKEVVPATGRNKERFRKYVEGLDADGGTNLWAGMELALDMKSLVYGDRYETSVDELFLLSDGAPTVGDVTDPLEILRLITETNRFSGVRINTVFITSPNQRNPRNTSLSPAELMKRIAEQNGGRFVKL